MQVNESPASTRAALWSQLYAALCILSALAAIPLLDRLTSVLLILSTFLFAIVCRYSQRYLAGDPGQSRFLFWLCLTGSFVFALVLSRNLLLFALAWCGVSLSLHQLLQFYSHRPAALLAARKKFLISRLGDAALLASLVLTHRIFGTWDFQPIFLAAQRLQAAGPENLPGSIHLLCALLVFAALLKSAQFPFHSWLPDTMETPTPVSALMHAGIINAGGILVIRLSPLVSLSSHAMLALVAIGGFTALFASTVMLTQASVKRSLAFSTVAQMGFMMLECGLGAFHLALLHIVAHSLYKAHAFLSSGSAVLSKPEPQSQPAPPLAIGLSLLAATAISFSIAAVLGVPFLPHLALNAIFSLGLAQMLWSASPHFRRAWHLPLALAAAALLSLAYFALHLLAERIVQPATGAFSPAGLAVLAAFLLVAVAQSRLAALARTSFGERLYVHARNGFYCNTLANRFTAALWPAKSF